MSRKEVAEVAERVSLVALTTSTFGLPYFRLTNSRTKLALATWSAAAIDSTMSLIRLGPSPLQAFLLSSTVGGTAVGRHVSRRFTAVGGGRLTRTLSWLYLGALLSSGSIALFLEISLIYKQYLYIKC